MRRSRRPDRCGSEVGRHQHGDERVAHRVFVRQSVLFAQRAVVRQEIVALCLRQRPAIGAAREIEQRIQMCRLRFDLGLLDPAQLGVDPREVLVDGLIALRRDSARRTRLRYASANSSTTGSDVISLSAGRAPSDSRRRPRASPLSFRKNWMNVRVRPKATKSSSRHIWSSCFCPVSSSISS